MDSIIIMVIHNRWPWRKKDRVRDTVNEEVIQKDREKEGWRVKQSECV